MGSRSARMAKASWRETRLAPPTVRQARWETGAVSGIATNSKYGQLVVNPSQTATTCLGRDASTFSFRRREGSTQRRMSRVPSPSLPDPTGFSSAPGVLSALGTFRDMSAIKELRPYLETLLITPRSFVRFRSTCSHRCMAPRMPRRCGCARSPGSALTSCDRSGTCRRGV
jgi:hypothetical protein